MTRKGSRMHATAIAAKNGKVPEYLEDPTFAQWCHHNRENRAWRELAAFIERDRVCWPRARTQSAVIRHLQAFHPAGTEPGVPTEATIRRAFLAYREDVQRGVKIPRRIGPDPMPREQRRRLKSYLLSPDTPKLVRKLKTMLYGKDGSLGAVVDRAIAELYENAKARR